MLRNKTLLKIALTALALSILSSAAITPRGYASNAPTLDSSLIKQLLEIARLKLTAEHRMLITGDPTELTKAGVSLNGKALEQATEVATVQLRRHKVLAEHGQRYVHFATSLNVEKAEISGQNATLTIREDITFTFVVDGSKEPVLPRESKLHLFHFTFANDQWCLVFDEEIGGPQLAEPASGIPRLENARPIDVHVQTSPGSKDKLQRVRPGGNYKPAVSLSGYFRPADAVNYARRYWGPNDSNYNPAYRNYNGSGGDCTNFVSQALNWGGWQHTSGAYLSLNAWWYNPNPCWWCKGVSFQ